MPAFLTGVAVRSVSAGGGLVPYPFPSLQDVAMVWQARDGFRYRLPGGHVLLPGPGDTAVAGRPSLTQGLPDAACRGQHLPTLLPAVLCGVADDLRVYRATTVVVTRLGAAPDEALASLAAHHCPPASGLP